MSPSLFNGWPVLIVPGDIRALGQLGLGTAAESHARTLTLAGAHVVTRHAFGLIDVLLRLCPPIGASVLARNARRSDGQGRGSLACQSRRRGLPDPETSDVGKRNHAGGNQQERSCASENKSAKISRLRSFDSVGNLGPHSAMANLVTHPSRGLVQALAQQTLGFVLRFF
jgi:hypothetical protein